jgi:hypothetical protein
MGAAAQEGGGMNSPVVVAQKAQFAVTFGDVTIRPLPWSTVVTEDQAYALMADPVFGGMVANGTYTLVDFPEGDDGVPS